MGTKQIKFVSNTEAIIEIKSTLLMQSELKKRDEVELLLRQLEDSQIRKGTKKVHPSDLVSRDGLWIKSQGREKFCYGIDLVELFLDLLSSKSVETLSELSYKFFVIKANEII
jgi:hypothetical protein